MNWFVWAFGIFIGGILAWNIGRYLLVNELITYEMLGQKSFDLRSLEAKHYIAFMKSKEMKQHQEGGDAQG